MYIFTHHTLGEQYLQLLPPYVGLLVFKKDREVEVLREAKRKSNKLEMKAMVASLRKPEYLELTRRVTGFILEVPAAVLYRTCLASLSDHSILKVQKAYFDILKSRNNKRSAEFVKENRLPDYLQYSLYHQKLNESSTLRQVINLSKRLKYRCASFPKHLNKEKELLALLDLVKEPLERNLITLALEFANKS